MDVVLQSLLKRWRSTLHTVNGECCYGKVDYAEGTRLRCVSREWATCPSAAMQYASHSSERGEMNLRSL